MKKLSIDEIKQYSFDVLCAVRDICEMHDISYSLTGGTLIGAIRHKGFIPWDDDIDIMIPRPDYDKFIRVVQEDNLPINVLSKEICGLGYPYAFAKACNPYTELVEKDTIESHVKLGVYVDIFPIDGIGKTYRGARLRTMMFQFLHGLQISSNWTKFRRSKLRKWYYEPLRYICYLFSKLLGRKMIDRWLDWFLRKVDFESANYAGRLVGDFGSREVMEQTIFLKTTKVEFEGQLFDAIADYDTFLTRLYGDYMKLPPKEKCVTHHEFEAYRV